LDDFKPMNPPTLHDDIKAMERGLEFFAELKASDKSARRPLTIEQIAELFDCKLSTLDSNANIFKLIDAVRKVEKAHGIY